MSIINYKRDSSRFHKIGKIKILQLAGLNKLSVGTVAIKTSRYSVKAINPKSFSSTKSEHITTHDDFNGIRHKVFCTVAWRFKMFSERATGFSNCASMCIHSGFKCARRLTDILTWAFSALNDVYYVRVCTTDALTYVVWLARSKTFKLPFVLRMYARQTVFAARLPYHLNAFGPCGIVDYLKQA